MNLRTVKWAQCEKPNPENCKNCSSKSAYDVDNETWMRYLRLIRTQDGTVCSTCLPANVLNLPSLDHIDSTVKQNWAILYPNSFYKTSIV